MSAPGGIRSTCPYCGVGCGVLLSPDKNSGLAVRGDPDHPANFGRLCSKGSALGETLGLEHRLLTPKVDGQNSDWDTALDLVADRFSQTIRDHGPDSVAFYVSGQLLTEDYYVANKLMKGFIGSANIDTNSRLCMASSVAGHKRAFGSDTVPGTYEDLDEADLVVLVGSNLAWCHPVLYQRLLAARKSRGTKIVVVDPRRTASCDGADLHLALEPGSDVALFNYLLREIDARGAMDPDFLQHTNGFEAALEAAQLETLSPTGLTEDEVRAFCDMWIGTEKTVTIYSQGVNQSTSGSDKVNAILNCHLATGRIGRPGMGPLSVTGQPNAMGGREVGGLANMLACHLDLENPDHRQAVRDFWQAPQMPEVPGLKAVDMFRAVADGRIKALWVIHTNPAVSMPDSAAVRAAIKACPFTVVSDITEHSDTARLARVLLPASAWGEKDGTVTNSDRTISRQRAALPAPGAARPDWQILCEVGKRMGWHAAFDYESPVEIFREYAALSGLAGQFGRDFDISGLSGLEASAYDTLAPTRWPVIADRSGGRFFADGNFYHSDKKARLLPLRYRPPAARTGPKYPFRLNTGRLRDQWHTMTRTGLSPRLGAHMPEPFLELHPEDAATIGIVPADLVEVRSPNGSAILRARIGDAVQPGQVFAPIHWTGETAPSGRIDDLVAAETDPVSGQPESKASVVAVQKMEAAWYGFAVSTRPMAPNADYWALAPTRGGYRAEMAGYAPAPDWEEEARRLFDLPGAEAATILDPARGTARIALFDKGRLLAALFVDREPVAVVRDYLATLPDAAGTEVLTGRPPADVPDPGPVICSCFGIGINTIISAIETQHLMTVEAIGVALEAGTNCGSCRPELAAILASTHQREAAE
ncbi:MAG: molybdopterin-dependent oxidoreductase [Pseudophaeobacter sp. bin_em_oilr2.035]|uniref:Molybdopterin-dependent oxidoreductase n=1 Tax=Phaeobacter gallaeciensis TaxID=60890 RepID=A0ABD4X7P0_9RHOB|nr:nitrate reductase [Phaeobacter gallaeciensis]MDF1772332.1 molybdopterin-dependent oxidoreductase [Pseudophaeobacter sp. bin_em_oilr2.035]MDE4060046.1 molybdopterin-dependent oxidoreductase [Phaeobacter gallaeciensis]MDE4122892.1 molybdopterin-dependent oxidoreductase [Phaeobacter gallaeciensis]MDE4127534.1 molybdopterin-dependent oxidoreductase [Phaeobacter gallaeciensis]MDE4144411.1 molybdopterin-dependent oxidoreductase [Phaeobacter gallaeciensis]